MRNESRYKNRDESPEMSRNGRNYNPNLPTIPKGLREESESERAARVEKNH